MNDWEMKEEALNDSLNLLASIYRRVFDLNTKTDILTVMRYIKKSIGYRNVRCTELIDDSPESSIKKHKRVRKSRCKMYLYVDGTNKSLNDLLTIFKISRSTFNLRVKQGHTIEQMNNEFFLKISRQESTYKPGKSHKWNKQSRMEVRSKE
jgi:hypothetical protein